MHGEQATQRAGSAVTSVTGDGIERLDLIGTVAFITSSTIAAVLFSDALKAIAVVVSLLLFTIGVATFLWSYWTAVQRSRTDDIAVAQLYFLTGGSTPSHVTRRMNGLLLAQVVVALVTAIWRNRTDGRPGSTLAFGILVPMFGLGLNGLWCSKYGRFSSRQRAADAVPQSADEMEQNSPHG